MESVSRATLSVISLVFLLALFSSIASDRHAPRMRYVSGAILTAYLIYLTVPIVKAVTDSEFLPQEIPDTPQTDSEDGEEALIKATSVQLCKEIKNLISARFAVPDSAFTVSVTIERNSEKEIFLKAVTVRYTSIENTISKTEAEAIAKYISDTLATKCTFIFN